MNFIEIEPSDGPDWSFFGEGEMAGKTEECKLAGRAARKIANQYEDTGTIEYDDALQTAYILMATDPALVRQCLSDPDLGYGVLYTRLCQKLVKTIETEAKHRSKHNSYEDELDKLNPSVV
jgi:hypothetical protein